jgi:predicted nucleic acid-binding protein
MLLDTNVLSELMRPRPDAAVLDWFAAPAAQVPMSISVITKAEILLGIALLPHGQKRAALAQAAQAMFDADFKDRVLVFDTGTAEVYARIVAERSAMGRPMSTEDAQIAATALQHRLPLVTRNTRDFEHVSGLQLINPWQG